VILIIYDDVLQRRSGARDRRIHELSETIDFQRLAVKVLQGNNFTVFCNNSTREKLTPEKAENPLTMFQIADRVPAGFIHEE